MNIILLGAPGAGKGSLASRLSNEKKFKHLSTGDIFRGLDKESDLGQQVQAVMASGQLVSDELTIEVVKDILTDISEPYILDGFPRNLFQAEALDTFAKIDKVLEIKTDDSILVNRITGRRSCSQCGEIYHLSNKPPRIENICDLCQGVLKHRADDTVEKVSTRLEVYYKHTLPLLEYYSKKGMLLSIDGSQAMSLVWEQCQDVLGLD